MRFKKIAIHLKKERLILGRTANEYKSNFGAVPIKSYIYLKIENKKKYQKLEFRNIVIQLNLLFLNWKKMILNL